MANIKKVIGNQCINVHAGKISYLLLKRRKPIPDTTGATVAIRDLDNSDDASNFDFAATIVTPVTASPNRVILKLVSPAAPGGGGLPTDGLLAITLTVIIEGAPVNVPVADVPVNYIDDPSGP